MTASAIRTGPDTSAPSPFRQLLPFWQITLASFLGWFLDAFDQTSLQFTLPDIAKDLGCTLTALGGVLMAQAIGRAIGNTGWGWLSDRYGRRFAFMLGVIWFAVFSAMTGLAHSILFLIVVQFMFGIGFGGEWTASAALLMESVPARTRPMASAIMMSGYEVGYFSANAAQELVLPHYGWRALFFIGLVPALLALFIRIGVKESPVWLRKRAELLDGASPQEKRPRPKFRFDAAAIQAISFMAVLEFQKAAIYTFYPTILRTSHEPALHSIFWPVTLYCIGSLTGKILCGWLAQKFGDLKVMLGALVLIVLTIWPFLNAVSWPALLVSAFVMGGASSGIFALVPHYLSKCFPSETRSFGMGLGYALGSLGQGIASRLIPGMGPTPATLPIAAESLVIGSSLLTAGIAILQPKHLPGAVMEGDEDEQKEGH
ncbi:sugar transport protein [Neokomagataea thailandica NBRC 106555]|uniref:MFS transporter n=2 Tax=Neokomagataea TaxID=1223423 RepID=A0A4Y6V656_9PROT|nr:MULTISPECIES: MFS transporter [Neokomagataea]QDH24358.1 MFS transporter [Neokomagataea tanensis]GBR53257.1 sugar transport protein [Neokomagataea thailandica NBRC 106555]